MLIKHIGVTSYCVDCCKGQRRRQRRRRRAHCKGCFWLKSCQLHYYQLTVHTTVLYYSDLLSLLKASCVFSCRGWSTSGTPYFAWLNGPGGLWWRGLWWGKGRWRPRPPDLFETPHRLHESLHSGKHFNHMTYYLHAY